MLKTHRGYSDSQGYVLVFSSGCPFTVEAMMAQAPVGSSVYQEPEWASAFGYKGSVWVTTHA